MAAVGRRKLNALRVLRQRSLHHHLLSRSPHVQTTIAPMFLDHYRVAFAAKRTAPREFRIDRHAMLAE